MRFLLAFAVGVTVLSSSHLSAEAQSPDLLGFYWSAPSGCPTGAEVAGHIAQLMGRPLVAFPQAKSVAPAAIVTQHEQSGFRLLVLFTVSGTRAERLLEHANCARLAEAAALMIALAVDPDATEAVKAAQGAAAPEPEGAAPLPEPPEPSPLQASALPRTPTRVTPAEVASQLSVVRGVSLGVGPLFTVGTLPQPSPGIGAHVALQVPGIELRAEGAWAATQRQFVPESTSAALEISWANVALSGCAYPIQRRFHVGACLGVDLSFLFAQSVGVEAPQTRVIGFGRGTLAAKLEFDVTRVWFLALGLDGSITPQAPRLGLRIFGEEREVFQPELLQLSAGFWGGVRFFK